MVPSNVEGYHDVVIQSQIVYDYSPPASRRGPYDRMLVLYACIKKDCYRFAKALCPDHINYPTIVADPTLFGGLKIKHTGAEFQFEFGDEDLLPFVKNRML